MYVTEKDIPESIREKCKSREYKVEVSETVRLSDNYWSDGTRYEYFGVDLSTGKVFDPKYSEYGNPFTHPEVPTVVLEPNSAIVRTGTFCGKKSKPVVYIHPYNAAKLLKNENSDLSREEKIVLVFTRSYKSSYAGISNYRFHEANERTGISLESWSSAKASCVAKKLLKKNGAITTDGRNAVDGLREYDL